MKREVERLDEIEEIAALLSEENKRYVLAVANALLFAQGSSDPKDSGKDGSSQEGASSESAR